MRTGAGYYTFTDYSALMESFTKTTEEYCDKLLSSPDSKTAFSKYRMSGYTPEQAMNMAYKIDLSELYRMFLDNLP